jgi:hypothetical protein
MHGARPRERRRSYHGTIDGGDTDLQFFFELINAFPGKGGHSETAGKMDKRVTTSKRTHRNRPERNILLPYYTISVQK